MIEALVLPALQLGSFVVWAFPTELVQLALDMADASPPWLPPLLGGLPPLMGGNPPGGPGPGPDDGPPDPPPTDPPPEPEDEPEEDECEN
jgi:hypothetical protein